MWLLFNLCLDVTKLIPNVETQLLFKESTQNIYNISYEEYYTERRVISDMITQADIGSSQQINTPKQLIGAHQARARADTATKNINIARFDNLNPQKHYVEINRIRYPRDSVLVIYEPNDYVEQ